MYRLWAFATAYYALVDLVKAFTTPNSWSVAGLTKGIQNSTPKPRFATVSTTVANDNAIEDNSPSTTPLTENWWPVIMISSLDQTKPNPLQLLGRKLVTYYDEPSSQWVVFDDRCSHRFAPLSEGRLLQDETETRLQCAYHGWEFKPSGVCSCVPQQPGATGRGVRSYPVQENIGILWVWPGGEQPIPNASLPLSSLLLRHVDFFGPEAAFMRDLPYGMELLGENLLDLSHLPYSHHSVGSLNRKDGNELQLKRIVPEVNVTGGPTPLYQVRVQNAGEQDPMFVGMMDPQGTRNEWTTFISFYSPGHVRYDRSRGGEGQGSSVELFICPLAAGKSRVFLFNCFDFVLPSSKDLTVRQLIRHPKRWAPALKKKLIQSALNPSRVKGHMLAHKIFDGDGIFLHKQGNRMSNENLTYRDYSTPSSADVLLNAFRRFLDKAALQSDELAARSVAGNYDDTAPRSVLLDRYESHTVFCKYCTKALQQSKRSKARWAAMRTALTGASGAFGGLTVLSLVTRAVAPPAAAAAACGVGGISSYLVGHLERRAERRMQSFMFEDYVHAEKD